MALLQAKVANLRLLRVDVEHLQFDMASQVSLELRKQNDAMEPEYSKVLGIGVENCPNRQGFTARITESFCCHEYRLEKLASRPAFR